MSLRIELRALGTAIRGRFLRLPNWLRAYLEAIAWLIVVAGFCGFLLHTIGTRATPFCSVLLLVLLARAAWIGYGPGLLVCTLTIFKVQSWLVPNRPHHVALVPFLFLIALLLVLSRVAQNKRRTEAMLRTAAAHSEQQAVETTLELSNRRSGSASKDSYWTWRRWRSWPPTWTA